MKMTAGEFLILAGVKDKKGRKLIFHIIKKT